MEYRSGWELRYLPQIPDFFGAGFWVIFVISEFSFFNFAVLAELESFLSLTFKQEVSIRYVEVGSSIYYGRWAGRDSKTAEDKSKMPISLKK